MDNKKLSDLQVLNQLILTSDEEKIILLNFAKMQMAENKLLDFDLSEFQPMVHNISLTNILREDIQQKNFTRDDLQKDAPEKLDGYWQVPRLVE